jgi:sec-independent protein translocase protein TatC
VAVEAAETPVSTSAPSQDLPDGSSGPDPRSTAAPSPNGSGPPEAGTMTVLEHLEELRQRIIISGIALLVGLIISALFLTEPAMRWLVYPAEQAIGHRLQVISPPEVFIAYLKVALFTGAALAMPVIIYQAFMFVLPALTPSEKRFAFILVPGATLSFVVGVAFGYFILLPQALGFLGGFGRDTLDPNWTIGPYLSFVTTLLFWIGVGFELPLLVFSAAKVGIVRHQQLTRYRKYAFLGAFVVAAVITPTPDPFNQTLVGLPLYLLYELGVLLARWAR